MTQKKSFTRKSRSLNLAFLQKQWPSNPYPWVGHLNTIMTRGGDNLDEPNLKSSTSRRVSVLGSVRFGSVELIDALPPSVQFASRHSCLGFVLRYSRLLQHQLPFTEKVIETSAIIVPSCSFLD